MITPKEEKILYITGAGFSAPLGLPVMGNFIVRSRDIYFHNPEKYAYFAKVYDTINKLAIIKNVFAADLYNIEEILSLLEMNSFMRGRTLESQFTDFLRDVINSTTPRIRPHGEKPGNWKDFAFGDNPLWKPYFSLLASLMGLEMRVDDPHGARQFCWSSSNSNTRYAVVTFNYDTVFERAAKHFETCVNRSSNIAIEKTDYDDTWKRFHLAKLHGCIEGNNIIPPTWRKANKRVLDAWKLAYNLIKDANHIRILGYSLPTSDSYVRYFLKAAAKESRNLKQIDVLSLDPDGSLRDRYEEFIDFKYFRFRSSRVENFLNRLIAREGSAVANTPMTFQNVEAAHSITFADAQP